MSSFLEIFNSMSYRTTAHCKSVKGLCTDLSPICALKNGTVTNGDDTQQDSLTPRTNVLVCHDILSVCTSAIVERDADQRNINIVPMIELHFCLAPHQCLKTTCFQSCLDRACNSMTHPEILVQHRACVTCACFFLCAQMARACALQYMLCLEGANFSSVSFIGQYCWFFEN